MRINQNTRIRGKHVIFVPYTRDKVLRYHEWMKSEELLRLTASEPLSLEDEYRMQESWAADEDKLSFIILYQDYCNNQLPGNEIDCMIGDINLFFNNTDNRQQAEVEVMIAESQFRGRGFGRESLLMILRYGIETLNVNEYTANILMENEASQHLFKSIGFVETERIDVFKEIKYSLPVTEELKKCLLNQEYLVEMHN